MKTRIWPLLSFSLNSICSTPQITLVDAMPLLLVQGTRSLAQPNQVGKGIVVQESGGKNTSVPARNQTRTKEFISPNARKRQI